MDVYENNSSNRFPVFNALPDEDSSVALQLPVFECLCEAFSQFEKPLNRSLSQAVNCLFQAVVHIAAHMLWQIDGMGHKGLTVNVTVEECGFDIYEPLMPPTCNAMTRVRHTRVKSTTGAYSALKSRPET